MNHCKANWVSRFGAEQSGRVGLRNLLGVFLAQGCPVCDRPTSQTLCTDCQRQIQAGPSVPLPLPLRVAAAQTEFHAEFQLPVGALGTYSGTLKRAILALKYGDRPDVATPLGAALGQQWLKFTQSGITGPVGAATRLYALPIPLHAERQKSRGYNQAELIAQAFCQVSGLSLLADGLTRTQATLPQHQLSLTARQQNLSQAFQVGRSLRQILRQRSAAVVLIDDIYTTGTTAQSAAVTLAQAGVTVVAMMSVARATLSSPASASSLGDAGRQKPAVDLAR
ncbi:ComF family protein [soil metagenome]